MAITDSRIEINHMPCDVMMTYQGKEEVDNEYFKYSFNMWKCPKCNRHHSTVNYFVIKDNKHGE